ncbi:hypothetical protein GGX14DRAFT_404110 [Mycena pura]|uniref:BTB domain-containing protein n=1 Tax=Mycena pura TaxID=153505 RepID=A0AAD6Y5L1_9AGAR|nr:hypothetical protein GGX14DRAFT_404110 [Mycena pura]
MYTRVHGLWFEDGGLIIKAESTIFRISKCLLAARSTFFSDMIILPPLPESDMELIDGIPVVTLPDPAKDVEVFLRAIIDSSYFMPPPKPVQLSEVLGILLLSHKYDVGYLFCRALEHLSMQFYFPLAKAYRSSKNGIEAPCHIKFSSTQPNTSELFHIIKICKMVGADWILPMAYYYAYYHIQQADLLSMTSEDDEYHSRLCLSASRNLILSNLKMFYFLKTTVDDCLDSRQCNLVRQGIWSYMLTAVQEPLDVAPLDSFREDFWEQVWLDENSSQDEDEPSAFCVHCYHATKRTHDHLLRDCWDRLPFFFCLPGWSDLEVVRQTVFGESTSGNSDEV